MEDWAARWHCTLQQQASVGWILITRMYRCFVCKLFLGEVNQDKHHKLLGFTSPLGFRCLLKKHFSNVAGRLGLLDYDEVELNNLHRQVLHGEENQGQAKALSAAHALKRYRLVLLHLSVSMYTCIYTSICTR